MNEKVDVFKQGQSVTLEEVLENREWRSYKQSQLEKVYPDDTVVAVKLNMPGAVKNSPQIEQLFQAGWRVLLSDFEDLPIKKIVLDLKRKTGPEGFIVLQAALVDVKKVSITFEESFFLGRLFDSDVMSNQDSAYQLSRTALGFNPRTCLVCGDNAKACARDQRHDLNDLHEVINSLYNEYFVDDVLLPVFSTKAVVKAASFGFLAEAVTNPKPGLVDPVSVGAHNDMNIYTFVDSTLALQDYFKQTFEAGQTFSDCDLKKLLAKIRPFGIAAEESMILATNGINTHKGAIFTAGILLAAYGYASRGKDLVALSDVQEIVSQMGADLVEKELDSQPAKDTTTLTAGQSQFHQYKLTGVRGEVQKGLQPLRQFGLKALRESTGHENDRLLDSLMALAGGIEDSTLIKRAKTPEITKEMVEYVETFQKMGGASTVAGKAFLSELDDIFIARHLSIGGAADYLILTALVGRLNGLI
ncbi:citrate lyase holo-[acyl-carrier protein] synthase [Fructobacillus durionis]|uniref:Holo-ACP synthase / triphosphoribosyl-dephospho-CoA synthase n=1 Tax=Fructobacillus durionis TaxID=283737 RepID=A0A1I1FCW0_9LACO|nr:citrate lyase holo-[acyl-carrier protein] synthase [Fructobacillus durionis]SFB96822.1 holo-ACP synthase / triphosphoribosyl-dephospho-CoA synthase [Fructobacillus durionis]